MINYTIIIPHYNTPKLLLRCLDTIPIRDDIQVIIVDDCSTDQTGYQSVCQNLNRPYLEFYKTPIGGSAGRARNIGLEHAKGKWLIFADADDFFKENFGHILDQYYNAIGDIIYFLSESVESDNVNRKSNRSDYFNNLLYKYLQSNDDSYLRFEHVVPWSKMIKRELVETNHIHFESTPYSNDVLFNIECGCKANQIEVVQEALYVVTSRIGSLAVKSKTSVREYICRSNIGFRAQMVINDSERHNPHLYVSGTMRKLLLENWYLFLIYWHLLSVYNFSQKEVYSQLSSHPNRKVRWRLRLLVATYHLIPNFFFNYISIKYNLGIA